MDDPNITIEEYIRLEEEKARRRGKVYNWETATHGKIWDNEDVQDLGSVETEFPTIDFNDTLTSETALSCEPTVSTLNNDEIEFSISFDESDDEDCMDLKGKEIDKYVLYKVEDIATCLVEYVKFWDDWEVDRYGNANLGRYGVSVPALAKDHKGIKLNTPYPEDQYAVLEIWNEYNILEDIKRGPYSKKSPIRRIDEFPDPINRRSYHLKTLLCEPTVSSLNNEIDFRVSFDDFDDEDYMVIFDKNSFSYKKNSTNDLKMDSENDNDKVNMPSFLSPEPAVSYFDDLDFFKDFENEFPAIVYNDALTSKLDFLTEHTVSPQHIDEFNLKDETSLFECDEEEQNVLNFNDLFPFNVIYPNDSKSDKDNDDDKVDIEHSSGDLSDLVKEISTNIGGEFTNLEILKCWSLETSRRLFNTESCS
ncbi:hypothetical protein Tco_1204581 [Tanacetum coccineum]